MYEITFHEDNRVTYYSANDQQWICRSVYVPDKEYATMTPQERERVKKHLNCWELYSIVVDGKPVLEGLLKKAAESAVKDWKVNYPSSTIEIVRLK